MKRTLAVLFVSLLVVASVAACGEEKKDDQLIETPAVTEDSMLDNPVPGGTTVPGDSDTIPGETVVPQSSGKQYGASYDQMLRNGRVHDSDGYLNDGENAVTPGSMF